MGVDITEFRVYYYLPSKPHVRGSFLACVPIHLLLGNGGAQLGEDDTCQQAGRAKGLG